MNLFQINSKIDEVLNKMQVDEETGEVFMDFDLLNALQVEHDNKIDNIACYIKNLSALSNDIKAEEKEMKKRRDSIDKKIERLKEYLDYDLQGKKFESARCKINYRKSKSTEVDEEEFLKYHKDLCHVETSYKYSKADLKKMIEDGKSLHGVKVVENTTMSIK